MIMNGRMNRCFLRSSISCQATAVLHNQLRTVHLQIAVEHLEKMEITFEFDVLRIEIIYEVFILLSMKVLLNIVLQRVLTLHAFWDLEKTVLHEICVSGIVEGSPLART